MFFRTPERREVAMALPATLAIPGWTLLSAKYHSAPAAASVSPKIAVH